MPKNPELVLIIAAADFAAMKHREQRRKGGDIPYINHPLQVARVLAEEGDVGDADVLAAAILHDTVEDTKTSPDELAQAFGERVARIVSEVTDDKSLPKVERKRHQIRHAREISPEARLVKLGDKLSNLRDLAEAPPPSWTPSRVRGYFVWASRVVEALGNVNPRLQSELDRAFARSLTIAGESFRAVPEDEEERNRVLEAYYRLLSGVKD